MNRKMLPVLFMLISGAITCIATFIHDYSILEKLVTLLLVMLVFGAMGSVLQHTLDHFDKQNAKRLAELEEEQAKEVEIQEKQENEAAKK